MSTTTQTRSTAQRTVPGTGPTYARVVRSELVKMRTLRSTWLTLLAAVVGLAGLGLVISAVTNAHFSQMPADEIARFDPVGRSLGGVNIAQLIWRVVLSSGVLKSPPDSGFRRGTQGRDGWPGPGWRACQGDARSD